MNIIVIFLLLTIYFCNANESTVCNGDIINGWCVEELIYYYSTWTLAEEVCVNYHKNAHLMSWFSLDMLEKVWASFSWVGMTDALTPTKYIFTNGANINISNIIWAQSEPDHDGECIHFFESRNTLNDYVCTSYQGIVNYHFCSYPINSSIAEGIPEEYRANYSSNPFHYLKFNIEKNAFDCRLNSDGFCPILYKNTLGRKVCTESIVKPTASDNATLEYICFCLRNYSGSDCEIFNCSGVSVNDPNVCMGNGKCTSYNHCECKSGYFGDTCEKWNCSGIPHEYSKMCGNYGNCSAPDSCTCQNYTLDASANCSKCFSNYINFPKCVKNTTESPKVQTSSGNSILAAILAPVLSVSLCILLFLISLILLILLIIFIFVVRKKGNKKNKVEPFEPKIKNERIEIIEPIKSIHKDDEQQKIEEKLKEELKENELLELNPQNDFEKEENVSNEVLQNVTKMKIAIEKENRGAMKELESYTHPPSQIVCLMSATMVLLGVREQSCFSSIVTCKNESCFEDAWSEVRRGFKELKKAIKELDKNKMVSINRDNIPFVTKLLGNLNIEEIQKVSKVCGFIFKMVTNILDFLKNEKKE